LDSHNFQRFVTRKAFEADAALFHAAERNAQVARFDPATSAHFANSGAC
jgi:hypothetical protein